MKLFLTICTLIAWLFAADMAHAQTSTQVVNNRLRIITNNQAIADFGSDFVTLNKPLAVQLTPTYSNEATSKQYVDSQIAAQIAALKQEISLLKIQLGLFNRNTSDSGNTIITTSTNNSNLVSAAAAIPNTLAATATVGNPGSAVSSTANTVSTTVNSTASTLNNTAGSLFGR